MAEERAKGTGSPSASAMGALFFPPLPTHINITHGFKLICLLFILYHMYSTFKIFPQLFCTVYNYTFSPSRGSMAPWGEGRETGTGK